MEEDRTFLDQKDKFGWLYSFASLKALNVKGQMSQELGERHLEKEIKGQKGNSFTTPPTHPHPQSQ